MIDQRPARSSKYQYLILERIVKYSYLCSFINEEGLNSSLNTWANNEDRLELEDKIKERFYQLLKEHSSKIQYKIFTLTAKGLKQVEIAKLLKCNQSGVTKCLYGNTRYQSKDSNGEYKRYGGLVKKMKRVIEEDPVIQNLLTQLKENYL